jgi:hypothetical protein
MAVDAGTKWAELSRHGPVTCRPARKSLGARDPASVVRWTARTASVEIRPPHYMSSVHERRNLRPYGRKREERPQCKQIEGHFSEGVVVASPSGKFCGWILVSGRANSKQDQGEYLYHGIAGRSFEPRFNLADFVQVKGSASRLFQHPVKPVRVVRAVKDGPHLATRQKRSIVMRWPVATDHPIHCSPRTHCRPCEGANLPPRIFRFA